MITNPLLPTQTTGATDGGAIAMLQKLIPYAISWAFIIGVLIFFFMFVIGAIKWIGSGGDKNKLEEARNSISHALIGLVILFSVYAIIGLIQAFFGPDVNLLNITLPTLGS